MSRYLAEAKLVLARPEWTVESHLKLNFKFQFQFIHNPSSEWKGRKLGGEREGGRKGRARGCRANLLRRER